MAGRVLGGLLGVGVVAAGAVVAHRRLADKKGSRDEAGGEGATANGAAIQMQELPADPQAAAGAAAPAAAAAAAAAAGAAAAAASAEEAAPSAPPLEVAAPVDAVAAALRGNEALLDEKELSLVRMLLEQGQAHIFEAWPAPGAQDADKRRLVGQLSQLDASYHGGLAAYISNAQQLLRDSKEGRNPFDGYTPSVPEGEALDFGSDRFLALESSGLPAVARAAFVLVAGGLGERLGYSGIKVALPAESASGRCFLQLYIEFILALQARSGAPKPLPLAIMTSDDTHARTQALLEAHSYFGMRPDQITLMKQEKVACLTDNDAHLALDPKDPFTIQTKPHGHGDVHALLHRTGLARKWEGEGFKWVCFFQDTNALVFRALLTALAISAANDYDMNSLAVPRRAKEAIGAIARLSRADGSSMTVNVEYNQLDPLLRATINAEGDVNDPKTGFSPFPGNINQLVIKLSSYVHQLHKTGGVISEFINPKYKDATRTAFKSSTRLECMMQDYPKALPAGARVGFTVVNQVWATYSPVKNSPADARAKAAEGNPTHSATTAEMDLYMANAKMLATLAGAEIGTPQAAAYNGIPVEEYPRVVLAPCFAPTLSDVEAKVAPRSVALAPRSVLILDGPNIAVRNLRVAGALVVRAVPGARVTIDGLAVSNAGWEWAPTDQLSDVKEEEAIRGFRVVRHATTELVFNTPGDYLVPERVTPAAPAEAPAAAEEEAAAAPPVARHKKAAAAAEEEGEAVPRKAPATKAKGKKAKGAVAEVAAAVSEAAAAMRAAEEGAEEEVGAVSEETRSAARALTAAVFASVAGAK